MGEASARKHIKRPSHSSTIMDHVGLLEPMWQQEEEGLTLLEATSTINHAPQEGIGVWAHDKALKGYT